MPIKGKLIKNYFKTLDIYNKKSQTFEVKMKQQQKVLKSLLTKARNTNFGVQYRFDEALNSNNILECFQKNVPVFDYEKMYNQWWSIIISGSDNVTWPGKIDYLALTSGTSLGATKRIPVSKEMIKNIRKTGFKHLCSIVDYNLPPSFFERDVLALGGSIMLKEFHALKEGDLSGILTANLPSWLGNIYLPGNEISKEKDWEQKIQKIVTQAPKWDVGVIAGVPSWVLLLMQQIISHYNLKTIHDIWPNFKIYAHGGVKIDPYISSINKLLKEEIFYTETYLASEGFFAYQSSANGALSLAVDGGIFFEFLPFDQQSFDQEGNIIDTSKIVAARDVVEGVEYALLISTCAGAWRYLIGDTVKFTDKQKLELNITGRIKHFVNLCGEHLSVENLNEAIKEVSRSLKTNTQEFSVFPDKTADGIYHRWVIGSDKFVDENEVKQILDNKLKETNADYSSVRHYNIKDLEVFVIPNQLNYDWMLHKGKNGGQNKYPRVFTKDQFKDLTGFLKIVTPEQCKTLF